MRGLDPCALDGYRVGLGMMFEGCDPRLDYQRLRQARTCPRLQAEERRIGSKSLSQNDLERHASRDPTL